MEKETVHKKESPRTRLILEQLTQTYPQAECELEYDNPFHLLVSVILSAQCTDKRVNEVTKELFKVYDTPEDFANADIDTLQRLIFSCGFYRNKSANIIAAARDIVARFNGKVPSSFDELLTLKGVGRKTANVVMAVAFGGNNIAVDTHVFRVSHRLGFSNGKTPFDVEKDLMAVLDPSDYSRAHHLLIFHGRYCCKSQRPLCEKCPVAALCSAAPHAEITQK
ncbi:MAG: endonuclease III [Clostridia bacterium]|nr:endonuclease III [Clostridia bacterium]